MSIYLSEADDLEKQIDKHNLKDAASVHVICKTILKYWAEIKQETCTIYLHTRFLTDSYRKVPALYARNLQGTSFPFINTVRRGDYIRIKGCFDKPPASFKDQVRQKIKAYGTYKCKKAKMPTSYVANPYVLARVLSIEMGVKIATIAKDKFVIFKIQTAVKRPKWAERA